MKFFSTLFWVSLLLIPLALVVAALQSVEKTALVTQSQTLSAPRVERAKALLREHDPRKLKDQETKTISISGPELELVANHLIQRFGKGGAKVNLAPGAAGLQASIAVPGLKPAQFINIDSTLKVEDNRLKFESLRIGKLAIPKGLANGFGEFVLMHAYRSVDIPSGRELVKAIEASSERLSVTYQFQSDLLEAVRSRLISPALVARLARYNDALVEFVARSGANPTLAELVAHLGGQLPDDEDFVADNRALVISLSNYINGRRLTALIPEVANWPTPKRVKVTAHGRHDLAQHFATSAALAVTGGTDISDAIGLYKEIDDADGGSGFSFKDLAADRAGTTFGEVATASQASARTLREQLNRAIAPSELIPDLTGFEEKMSDAEFKARYGGIEDQRYLDVVAEIDHRIANSVILSGRQ